MLLAIASILLALAGTGCVLHGLAIRRLARFLGRPELAQSSSAPLTFWRALKPGVPNLGAKLDALVSSSRPEDQILIGVDADTPDATFCEEWRQRHAERDIAIVHCAPQRAKNPKLSKFLQMRPAARHSPWLLTDSEATLTPEFVEQIRAEWEETGADALTAGYRFVGLQSVWEWLDTLPAALTLWPGLMMVKRLNFTLGACTSLRAEDLDSIGGWEKLGDSLAEDHELGQLLTARGKKVHLSRNVLELDGDPLTIGAYFRHQHRVAVTYRAANPAGALGLPIFQVLPLAIAATIAQPALWHIALLCVALRIASAVVESRIVGMSRGIAWIPLVLLMESFFWLLSWLPLPVWWAGKWRRIDWRGRFQ